MKLKYLLLFFIVTFSFQSFSGSKNAIDCEKTWEEVNRRKARKAKKAEKKQAQKNEDSDRFVEGAVVGGVVGGLTGIVIGSIFDWD